MPRQSRGTQADRAPDGRRIYSLGDVTKYTDVKRPQAQYWLKHRLIVPDYKAGGGPGKYHGFTFRNLVEFDVARRLSWIGASLDFMGTVLERLRLADPDDWYELMPRLDDEIEAVLKKKKRRPTKKQALAWLDAHGGHLDFKDPKVAAEFSRHATASGLYKEDPPLSEDQQHKLTLWRQFKDPATRVKDGPPVLLCFPMGMVYGGIREVETFGFFQDGNFPTVSLNLTVIFEQLESVTGDHWNNLGVQP
jgi:hypothetical protein